MSRFAADWLSLRETFDTRARNADVVQAVAETFKGMPSLIATDLACGTGATRRALSSHLPMPQHWRLYDNDLSLLARAAAPPAPAGCTIKTIPVDLVHDLEATLDGAPDLIATSALLDLVSEEWLERLTTECAARNLPLYAALTYTGEIRLDPVDRLDAAVVATVNRHQSTDKGFGPALGAEAAAALTALCKALGFAVVEGPSDWILTPEDREMQSAMLTQWAQTAQSIGDIGATDIAGWFQRRREFVAKGVSVMRVGHRDVFARPMQTR
jgi:hypothetical protein